MANIKELAKALSTPLAGEEQQVPKKPRTREIVRALHPSILKERQRGTSWDILAQRLCAHDVAISGKTLARYVGEINTQKRVNKAAKAIKGNITVSSKSSTAPSVSEGSFTLADLGATPGVTTVDGEII